MKWAIVLVANQPYFERSLATIHQARSVGQWKDDIILMYDSAMSFDEEIKRQLDELNIILIPLPQLALDVFLRAWSNKKDHENYEYIMSHPYIYMKFFVFHRDLRQWNDRVFYIDAGVQIQGPLERMKVACQGTGVLYAHSDAYPRYEWSLRRQFCFDICDNETKEEMEQKYNLDCDYFQTTIMIFDTKIIEEDTIEKLFSLAEKYPFAGRMDQGIINLHFLCERKLWKQIPVMDDIGFLYDFIERPGCLRRQYLMLKYPMQLLN